MNQGQVIFGGGAMSQVEGQHRRADADRRALGRRHDASADAVRGPFEDDIDWKLIAGDPDKRPGVTTWLSRVFGAVDDSRDGRTPRSRSPPSRTGRWEGVTEDMDRFRFNLRSPS